MRLVTGRDGGAHGTISTVALAKLNHLGPLSIRDVLANSKVIGEPIDEQQLFASKFVDRVEAEKSWHGLLTFGGKKRTGVGRYIDFMNNTIYEGQIKAGKPHGFGRRIFTNGSYYLGFFKKGTVHGFGTLHNKRDAPEEQGHWENGVLRALLTPDVLANK